MAGERVSTFALENYITSPKDSSTTVAKYLDSVAAKNAQQQDKEGRAFQTTQRELTENRKDRQKASLEKFWTVVKDYKLPVSLDEVDVALGSSERWDWNFSRMSHTEQAHSLKYLLTTLPNHYADFTMRAGMNEREQAIMMIGWLELMKEKLELEYRVDLGKRLEAVRKVFLFLLRELSR